MERLSPENCEKLQELGLPTDFASGSFFKPDGINFCYCRIPYILNSHECTPCWSLNDLFNYLKKEYADKEIICTTENPYNWTVVVNSCKMLGHGDTVLEAVYDVIIKILENVRTKENI